MWSSLHLYLEVCDCFSDLSCGASPGITSHGKPQAWGMHRVLCVQGPAEGSLRTLVFPPSAEVESRGYLLKTNNLQISSVFFSLRGRMLKSWMAEMLDLLGNPQMYRDRKAGIRILLLPSSCRWVFWRYSHKPSLGIWLAMHESVICQSRGPAISGKPVCPLALWF